MIIRDLLGLSTTKGRFGIELEIEGSSLPRLAPSRWRTDIDGSLRGEAFEYVTPTPLDKVEAFNRLDYIKKHFNDNGATINKSVRAGTHVHVNVQELTPLQVYTLATLYFVLEGVLIKWCGPSREGNLFCLRASDAEHIVFKVEDAIERRDITVLNDTNIRYCSLNFCSLFTYGSLEFRGMAGTQNFDDVKDWINLLDDVYTTSLTFSDPYSVIEAFSGYGVDDFIPRVLPNSHHLLDLTNAEELLFRGVRAVQSIAYKDWSRFSAIPRNPFTKVRRESTNPSTIF